MVVVVVVFESSILPATVRPYSFEAIGVAVVRTRNDKFFVCQNCVLLHNYCCWLPLCDHSAVLIIQCDISLQIGHSAVKMLLAWIRVKQLRNATAVLQVLQF